MLNIEQRAKRATSRTNKRLAKRFPLFASEFSVTVESQVERLQKMDVSTDNHFEALRNAERNFYKLAMKRRSICESNMPPELFAEQDSRAYRIYGTRGKWSQPEYSGAFYANWWWHVLKEFVPAYAQAHCPNSQFHQWEIYQAKGECPTCKARLTKRAADGGDSARQLSFI